MSDSENPDLVFKEVDEEVRRERVNALWRAYGRYLIGAAVGVVIVIAGREIYMSQKESAEAANSAAYDAALKQIEENPDNAASILGEVASKAGASYGALASLQQAAALSEEGNVDEALGVYKALAADSSVDQRFRDLAIFNQAMITLNSKEDANSARSRLSLIAVKGNPWYYSAVEQLAFIDMIEGKGDEALNKLAQLINDGNTPQSMQNRLRKFRTMLESERAVVDAPADATVDAAEEKED